MCSSKYPKEYSTLLHICNANNKTLSTKDSLKLLSNILLTWASNETDAQVKSLVIEADEPLLQSDCVSDQKVD